MTIVEKYINEYKKQYDFYAELAKIVHRKLEDELISQGIKAIVTYRAKRPDRLKTKLLQRNEEKNYKSQAAIKTDIVDLAGVRSSLYFPSERTLLDEIIKDLFNVELVKIFPSKSHKPKHNKRFSGYWATHYRVTLKKDEDIQERYYNTVVEVQVASLLMHAWSEVEHDMVYKPLSGKVSEEELAILDEINGLVLSGEIALERLQKAMTKRTQESNEINNKYELTNFIFNNLNSNSINKLKFGKTDFLNNYLLNYYNKFDTSNFKKYINKINSDSNETISDQLVSMIFLDLYSNNESKTKLKEMLSGLENNNFKQSGFESFIKTWIILEKAVMQINRENNISNRKYFVPDFKEIKQLHSLTPSEKNDLNDLRKVRNFLLHGIEQPSDAFLDKSQKKLKKITEKVIAEIQDEQLKNQLLLELNE